MSFYARLMIALLCVFLVVGSSSSLAVLCCVNDPQSEYSDSENNPESENETESLDPALLGRRKLRVQAVLQPTWLAGSAITAQHRPLAYEPVAPATWQSVSMRAGLPLRC